MQHTMQTALHRAGSSMQQHHSRHSCSSRRAPAPQQRGRMHGGAPRPLQQQQLLRVAQQDQQMAAGMDQQPRQQQQLQPKQQQQQQQQQQDPVASQHGQRIARFAAQKHAARAVPEADRPLAAYMALPASQYSVLDARRIERLDDTTFRCYVGRLAFLSFSVEPVITVSVVVEERGCTIKLLSAQLSGSPAVAELNSRFSARMTNVVRWAATEEAAVKQISSDTSIEVVVQVPAWAGFLPLGSIEASGSRVMATTLNLMVPRFLEQLQRDYAVWAAGDESRKPIGDGSL